MNYTITPKKVIYNTKTKETLKYFSGKKGEVVFDSIGEFKCYKILSRLNTPIEVHKYINHLDWKIDFTLSFVSPNHFAIPLFKEYGYYLDKSNNLYIEFKGVIDDKTVNRYKSIPDIIQRNIAVVTNSPNTITYYCDFINDIVRKPTLSIKELRSLCNGC